LFLFKRKSLKSIFHPNTLWQYLFNRINYLFIPFHIFRVAIVD
jgi:hypothetical protein